MTDVTWIIIGLLIAAIGAFFGIVKPWIHARLDPQQLAMLQIFAKSAVAAAEQIITLTTGKDKKAFAMEKVKKFLEKYGMTFDDGTVSTVIEEQVYEMNKEKEKKGEEQ